MRDLSDSNKKRIQGEAQRIRKLKGNKIYDGFKFDLINCLEILQDNEICGYAILPSKEMRSEAETSFEENVIIIAEDTYIAAYKGNPRARFIIAHEIGHIILHYNKTFSAIGGEMEEEANCFAMELLVPTEVIIQDIKKCRSKPYEYANLFGVEKSIAEIQQNDCRYRLSKKR